MTALGSEHSIVVTEDGEALSWGAAGAGRLGHGHKSSFLGFAMTSNEYTPRLIKNLDGIKIKRIAAGMLHSACIDEKGTVFMFGQKTEKVVLGRSNDAPRPSVVEEIQFSEEVACGGYHTCAVTAVQTDNISDQPWFVLDAVLDWNKLGNYRHEDGRTAWNGGLSRTQIVEICILGVQMKMAALVLVSLPRGTGMVRFPEVVRSSLFKLPVSKVSCGWKHTAVISGEDIYTWGWGGANGTFFEEGHSSGGQLGHGNDVDYCEPMMVELGKNARAVHVSCGFNHTGAILEYAEN
ncbi:hypothetical protein TRIUR3_23493 [Triticum urartu]|uniref:Ultraviolet-B receptor UVR8 n=1 Tax=Triticum urartu TaxID=4572 RepID=M7ZN09_TRIUA|nr:hypothetical protein TRIUR3_23493 [Triticum urartu]